MKKLNIKKTTKNKKEKKNNVINFKAKPSKLFLLIIAISGIILFLISCFNFGFLISLLVLIAYIFVIILTQVLDNNPKKSKKRKWIKAISIFILSFGIAGIVGFIGFFTFVVIKSPDLNVEKLERKETTLILDNKGEVYATLGTEKREKISYNDLPEVFIDALIATEDSRFFQHNGFDAPRFFKATLGQVMGQDAGGASTLTMQVSKNSLTSFEAEGIEGIIRKFTDIYMSIFKIEKAFSKQEIIEFYVNTPFLGNNSYGVEQAAQTYFGKNISEVNLSEAALIAGLFQAPSAYDPFLYPEEAYDRRDTVLSLMVMHGYITEEEKEIANKMPIENLVSHGNSSYETNEFQGYIDTVVNEVEAQTGLDPYTVPMVIHTNMDRAKQKALNDVFKGKTYKWPNKTIQGGAVAIDVNTGKIIAIGAGRNRVGERGFSYATDINRQIGSTAKPLFDYAPGIEYNNWSTAQMFKDEKWTYSDGTVMTNYDNGYKGEMTLRDALVDSRNVTALKAFQSIDNSKIKNFVTTLGIEPEIDEAGGLHEAHSIGAFNGASPLQMAAAYAAFSNGGYYYAPYTVNKIELRETEEQIEFESEKVKAMSDSTAYMITNMLRGVASEIGVTSVTTGQVAAKTGTTNYDTATQNAYDYPSNATPDGWIAGYTTNVSLAMWTGYIENTKGVYLTQNQMVNQRNGLYKACAKAVFDKNGKSFTKPSSAVWVTVEKGTNPVMLPSEDTPKNMRITELFKRGTEPTEISSKYKALSNVTGLSIEYTDATVKLKWNSVIEPTDINKKEFGNFGYKIYHNGNLIEFTTNNYYNYSTSDPYGTYTVKTAYSKKDTNISSGVSVSLKSNIIFEFLEDSSVELAIGETYVESVNPIIVYEDLIDVTSSATITKAIVKNSTGEIVTSIDSSVSETYTITYEATYKDSSETYTKIVTIK